MQIKKHPLHISSLGTERSIVSFHYGRTEQGQGRGEKIYIQASLHADELPGMLVAHHLRSRLAALEARGDISGEIIVVPVANPIGLSQMLLHSHLGRFETATGENFNRHYPTLIEPVAASVADKLTDDGKQNVVLIRQAMREALNEIVADPETTEVVSMRKALMTLACDADVVLDLHCDANAAVHLYTGTPLWPQCEPLARYLGAVATLLATESGDSPFDEACSQTWWQLAAKFPNKPIPMACLSVTVELRGLADVSHPQAEADADRIIDFLKHRGVVKGNASPLPPLKYPATPLAGSEPIITPSSGVVAYLLQPGDYAKKGDVIAEVINPISGDVYQAKSGCDGVLYAQENRHFAVAGMRLAKVAGATAFRSGKLLSA